VLKYVKIAVRGQNRAERTGKTGIECERQAKNLRISEK
jgi:hypothetical protein